MNEVCDDLQGEFNDMELPFPCEICDNRFASESNLTNHKNKIDHISCNSKLINGHNLGNKGNKIKTNTTT